MKLCLGTAQFGMNYGVQDQKKPNLSDSIDMLDYAVQNGVNVIDTAYAYGVAEEIIGEFIAKKNVLRDKLKIVTKQKPNIVDDVEVNSWYNIVKNNLESSLRRLQVDYLDGYLLHSSKYIFNQEIIEILQKLKVEGYIKNIGVSIYEYSEANKAVFTDEVDIIQIPYSIVDQRLDNSDFFINVARADKTIYSRSAFLQGLILMDEEQVPKHLAKARPIVKTINNFCIKEGISRVSLAINYIKQHQNIDYLVFGVDNIQQLKEYIDAYQKEIDGSLLAELADQFRTVDIDIVSPNLWAKK